MRTPPIRTADELQAARVKARASRVANAATRKASTLRRDFLDADLWLELATKRGLRLPPWGEPATVSNMRTWIHKLGWSQSDCEEWAGCKLRELIARNPTFPARALAGIMLEEQTDRGNEKSSPGEGGLERGA